MQLYLSQPNEQVKDMGVVVDHRPSGDIGGKLSLALSVECLIEVILSLIKPVLPQSDGPAVVSPHSKIADLSSISINGVSVARNAAGLASTAGVLVTGNAAVQASLGAKGRVGGGEAQGEGTREQEGGGGLLNGGRWGLELPLHVWTTSQT